MAPHRDIASDQSDCRRLGLNSCGLDATVPFSTVARRWQRFASNKIRFALHPDTYKISPRRTATGPFAHCIVARSATISIFADLPHPSDEITLTTSGGIIRGLYRHSTHSGLYTELSEWARGKFGCLLSDAWLDARSDASIPLSSHSSHNDRRDPDPVGRCQPHISRSSLSERCAGGLVLRHCVGANLPDAHVVFSAYRKDRAAE